MFTFIKKLFWNEKLEEKKDIEKNIQEKIEVRKPVHEEEEDTEFKGKKDKTEKEKIKGTN